MRLGRRRPDEARRILNQVDTPPSSDTAGPARQDLATVEHLRRIYASNRDWYNVSDSKAQILLAANGAFISIFFGVLLGVVGNLSSVNLSALGPETWIFLGISVGSVVGSVTSAVLCMWSLYRKPARAKFARFSVGLEAPSSYPPELLWYFGDLALLDPNRAVERLRQTGMQDEIDTLSYHIVELSGGVLRKHKCINAGWAFTGLTLIALAAASASLLVRIMIG